ncbi:HIRA-interacting protein 3 [Polyodon spathula]|uniref:HIRA-interacting protein 3 n=1 Tax=Polyodon spathula TaxID=7913 RepID=UPI001B7E3996|nr:HIRA-interacting protein 3 [Polyodon spathula]
MEDEKRARGFVSAELKRSQDLSAVTHSIVRERYLRHIGHDSLSKEDRQRLKRIVEEELLKMQNSDTDSSDDEPLILKAKGPKTGGGPKTKRKRESSEEEEEGRGGEKKTRLDLINPNSPDSGIERLGKEEREGSEGGEEEEERKQGESRPERGRKRRGEESGESEGGERKKAMKRAATVLESEESETETCEGRKRQPKKAEEEERESEGSQSEEERESEAELGLRRKKSGARKEGSQGEEPKKGMKQQSGERESEEEEGSESDSGTAKSKGTKQGREKAESEGEQWKKGKERGSEEEESTSDSSLPSLDEEERKPVKNAKPVKSAPGEKRKREKEGKRKKSGSPQAGEEHPSIRRLKRYVTACGAHRNYKRLFEGCRSNKAKIGVLRRELEEMGVQGNPSLEKCKRVKLKREEKAELASLDLSNIIEAAGRPRRKAAAVWDPFTNPRAPLSPPREDYRKCVQSGSESGSDQESGAGGKRRVTDWDNLRGVISDDMESD